MIRMSISTFIKIIRNTDVYIKDIYISGGCYQFYLLLKQIYPGCKPYINKEKDHIITKYYDKFYDITGEVSGDNFTSLSQVDYELVNQWSFAKNKALSIGRCKYCKEPILV